ncbi:MAG: 30S ribosomal protein S4 [Rickettsiaceae bacterium]|nr:30S ribosomal protein S4 [Rickettsiaceae bacterium]
MTKANSKKFGAKYKVSRRLGASIWGDAKDPFLKKNYKPGTHGPNAIAKSSDYGNHLRAKQRIKSHYGRINERQFRNLFLEASSSKGNTGENFLAFLESRLDAAVYRMMIGSSIFLARQLVSHGHILVNGKRVNIPSYRLKVGDKVEVKESSKQLPVIAISVAKGDRRVPDYFSFDKDKFTGTLLRKPSPSDIPFPFEQEVNFVVEFYSK